MAKYISLISGAALHSYIASEVIHENKPADAEGNPRMVLTKNANGVFLLSIGGDDLVGESMNADDYQQFTDALVLDCFDNKQAAVQLRELADYLENQ